MVGSEGRADVLLLLIDVYIRGIDLDRLFRIESDRLELEVCRHFPGQTQLK